MTKVLVADDSQEFLNLYSNLIMNMGITVLTAENGAEAIRLAWKENPDLIFLDLEMPEMTGAECTRLLKQDPSCKDVSVVIITSHISAKDMEACYKSGANEIVAKPFTEEQIVNLLKRYLARPG